MLACSLLESPTWTWFKGKSQFSRLPQFEPEFPSPRITTFPPLIMVHPLNSKLSMLAMSILSVLLPCCNLICWALISSKVSPDIVFPCFGLSITLSGKATGIIVIFWAWATGKFCPKYCSSNLVHPNVKMPSGIKNLFKIATISPNSPTIYLEGCKLSPRQLI